jgi:hypothetical protein
VYDPADPLWDETWGQGLVVLHNLGRDEHGEFRAIEMDVSLSSHAVARGAAMKSHLERHAASGQKVFLQG